jgi:hypothetical protein
MEPSKNSPGPLVIDSIAIIVVMIVFYFIITMIFPYLLQSSSTGEIQAVPDN